MASIYDPDFDEVRRQPGFQCLRARLGRQIGSERLGVSLWELPAGQAAYPFHFHYSEEELVIVLAGCPSLRTPDGWRELQEGEVIAFARGQAGAHQLVNRSDLTVRFIAVSTSGEPDIVSYPDSGKLGVSERRPDGTGLHAFFSSASAVDYYAGEQPPTHIITPVASTDIEAER